MGLSICGQIWDSYYICTSWGNPMVIYSRRPHERMQHVYIKSVCVWGGGRIGNNVMKGTINPLIFIVGSSCSFANVYLFQRLRVTSHRRLRARDHFSSSTLIDGKGGAGPSSLYTTLEGPTECVSARWI